MLIKILENKEVLAGFLWAFTLPIKLYALIFLPYFIVKKKFKIILWSFVFSLIVLFLPSVQYGLKGNIRLLTTWKHNLSLTTPPLLGAYDNASIYALLIKWFDGRETIIRILLILIMLFLALLTIYIIKIGTKKKLKNAEILESSILFILIPLLSPLGWYYNYLYSILGIMILINYFGLFPRILKYFLIFNLFLIGGTLYEILGRELFRLYM
ncbi:glycosyltransferase 87 family protein, partial [SCandidatus Aminicenantes bacterium Aminicenantia_JdfR_composite]|nr:glycosyltransferase 87 family protein [SCandidatus Aminicenantes bacterium Aminicenantia_JdfR_composite]